MAFDFREPGTGPGTDEMYSWPPECLRFASCLFCLQLEKHPLLEIRHFLITALTIPPTTTGHICFLVYRPPKVYRKVNPHYNCIGNRATICLGTAIYIYILIPYIGVLSLMIERTSL